MINYETIYIINPNVAEEGVKEVITKFNDLIEKQKGVIVRTEEWGTQKMAYVVKKFDSGSYVLVNYCGAPGITIVLERDLKLDDRVILYQTIKLADKVDPQELIRKEKEAQKERADKETEAPALNKDEMVQDDEITPN